MAGLTQDSASQPAWLQTPLGTALLAAEHAQLAHALEGIFGEHLLQIGRWGDAGGLVKLARTQHATTVYQQGQGGEVSADFSRLPFESNSVDAVILPHTLDLAPHPHDVLRESHRVLRAEGRLVIMGFKPFGVWGARRLWSRGRFPPTVNQALGDRVLRDWLRLLDMRLHEHQRFFFRWPINRFGKPPSRSWEQLGQRWWPELAACYLLHARKRTVAMTPIRPSWRRRVRAVGGLPEPSLRKVTKISEYRGRREDIPPAAR
ncbi:MAG: class I SAM-dependent methyltransferase [Pseudomonadota bacterium]